MEVIELAHPLAAVRLAHLRSTSTDQVGFRRNMSELTRMLVYEATKDLPTTATTIDTPLAPTTGVAIASSPVLIPVLRAGLGMLDGAMTLLPESEVAFVGTVRHEEAADGDAANGAVSYEHYVNRIPDDMADRSAIVLDPALATGGTLVHTCEIVANSGAESIAAVCVLASPQGVAALQACGLVSRLVVAAIDTHLDERFYIVPGLGDAGDRLYGLN